jgi:hypothetical protein
LGNEIDLPPDFTNPNSAFGCWGDSSDGTYYGGQRYGDMLKVVYPQIKAANPAAKVWIGGLLLGDSTSDQAKFLRGVLQAGGGPYFDILPYHAHGLYYGVANDPYISPNNPWFTSWGGGMRGKARFLKSVMAEYNLDKPMMVNEIGVGCVDENIIEDGYPCGSDQFDEFKADMSVRLALRAIDEKLMGIVWYTLDKITWRDTGLLNEVYTREPAFYALQYLGQRIARSPYLGPDNYSEDLLEGYTFQTNGNQRLQILWLKHSSDPVSRVPIEDQIIRIPSSKLVSVKDRNGNDYTYDINEEGNAVITIGFSPVYITRWP